MQVFKMDQTGFRTLTVVKLTWLNIYRAFALTGFLFFTQLCASAQEMLGTTLGNYAGLNSVQLNPSAIYNSKTYLDVQLFGLDVFFQSNYLYMKKSDYRFSNFFKSGYEWPTHQAEYGTEQRIFYLRFILLSEQ
ncbi:MAG: hypothetical protein NTW16_13180 [Bacteroidetes bacterium]|nr:hypothetical protein [Bacteroidota bacterium]